MATGILSGLIGGLGSVATSIIQGQQQRQNVNRQLSANKELARYQFDQNKKMWDEQNLYNSPQAQMQRYKEAGLNPNLIYNQGSPGNAQTAPRYESPQVDYSNIQPRLNPNDIINQFMDWNMKNASLNNLQANNAVINENARSKKIANDVAEKWAEELAMRKADLLYSQSYYAHESGRYAETKARIQNETAKDLIDYVNHTNKMRQLRNNEELLKYQYDVKLRRQSYDTNQLYLNFMQDPRMNWANFIQAWKIFSPALMQGAGLMFK